MMYGLRIMMSTGWDLVQSTLSTICGVLFSPPSETLSTRRPMGLNELILTKGYWVDRQREVFAGLKESDELTPKFLQSALDELLGQLGARLGSPAVMLLELERLHKKITCSTLMEILRDAKASTQASMIKDPKVAYANLMADIQLLCEGTSMQFINSSEGRAWLEVYRPFFNDVVFEQALSTIVDYANTQIGELYSHLEGRGVSTEQIETELGQAQGQVIGFSDWSEHIVCHRPLMIELSAKAQLEQWHGQGTLSDPVEHEVRQGNNNESVLSRTLSALLHLAKSPIIFISRYPKLTSGLLLALRGTIALAEGSSGQRNFPQPQDVTNSLTARRLGENEFAAHEVSNSAFRVRNVSDHYHNRHLYDQAGECFTGIDSDQGWVQTLGGPADDYARGLAIGPQGQIVVVGFTSSFGAGAVDGILVQYDAQGALNWALALGGVSNEYCYDVVVGSQGQIVLAGHTESYGEGQRDALLAEFSANGTLVWAKTLGGAFHDSAEGISVGPQGQIVLVGSTRSYGAGLSDVLVAQYDAQGRFEWAQALGGGSYDYIRDVEIGTQGQIVAFGATRSYGAGSEDFLLMQFSADGRLEWAQTLGGTAIEYGYGMALGPQGKIVVVGDTQSYSVGQNDVLLAQFSAGGVLEWVYTLGSHDNDVGYDVTTGIDGKILLVGATDNYGAGAREVILVQLSAEGQLEWSQTLGGALSESGYAVAIDQQGQIVLAGGTSSYGAGYMDILLAQIPLNGRLRSFSEDFNVEYVTHQVELVGVNSIANQMIFPQLQNITVDIVSQTPLNFGHQPIPASAVSRVTNKRMAHPIISQEFVVAMDGHFTTTSKTIGVDLNGADWLHFDYQSQVLTGAPLLIKPGQIEIQLITDVPGYGVVTDKLFLCVKALDVLDKNGMRLIGGASEYGKSISFGPAGQIAVLGETESFGAGNKDLLLIQYDVQGKLKWAQALGGSADDVATDVAIGLDGQVVVLGRSKSFTDRTEVTFLAKFASDGSLDWALTLSGFVESQALAVGRVGQIVVVGVTESNISSSRDALVAQFTTGGILDWARSLGANGADAARDVTIGALGQVVAVGATQLNGTAETSILLLQYDQSGQLDWVRAVGGNSSDATAVAIGLDDQIVLAGHTVGQGIQDTVLAQFNATGNLSWMMELGGSGHYYAESLAIGPASQITLVGYTNSYASSEVVYLVRCQGNGSLSWFQTLSSSADNYARGVVSRQTGEIVVVGEAGGSPSGSAVLLAELDQFGEMSELQDGFSLSKQAITSTIKMPVMTDISSNVVEAAPAVNASMITELRAYPLASFPPVHALNFGQYFEIDFKHYLNGISGVYNLIEANTLTRPSWLDFDSTNLVLSGTPSGEVRGQYVILMTVRQFAGQSRVGFILDVINTPPYLSSQSDFQTSIGRFVLPIGSNFADQEGDKLGPFAISRINGIDAAPIASIDVETGRFFGTTLSGDQGSYQFNITAADPYGGLGWKIVTLDVLNTPPARSYIFSNPSPVLIGQGRPALHYQFPINAFSDPDGDTVSYEASAPNFINFDSASLTLTGHPASSDAGVHAVEIIAADPYGGQGTVTIYVTVIQNSSPAPGESPAQQILAVNQVKNWAVPAGTFSDSDSDALTYSLTRAEGLPGWISITDRIINMTPRSGAQGDYVFSLVANDGFGGQATQTLVVLVANSAPILSYAIPVPQVAYAGQMFSHEIPADNFDDADLDSLTYHALMQDGTNLPDWLRFNPIRRIFSGTPTGPDRGTYPIHVWVEDVVDAQAGGVFNLTIANSVPQALRPMRQQTVSQLESQFSFRVDELVDPDGDPVTYTATLGNGDPLPAWVVFDPVSREFRVSPRMAQSSGNYPIRIIATDSEGQATIESFDLTVQSPPEQPEDDSIWAQYLWTAVASSAGLAIISATVMWRANRIKMTNSKLKTLASQYRQAENLAKSDEEMHDLMATLIQLIRAHETGNETILIHQTQRYVDALMMFAIEHVKPGIISRLKLTDVFNEFCDMLLNILASKHLGEPERFNRTTHSMIYALGLFMNGVTLAIAQQGNLIIEDIERKWIGRIDEIKGFVESAILGTELRGIGSCGKRKASLRRVHTVYALNALREATVYLPDTSTLLGLLKESLLHVVAPAKLLSDFRFIVTNVPSKWYMSILNAKLQTRALIKVENEDDQLCALRNMQYALTEAMRETLLGVRFKPDWRLCYGALNLFVEMLKHDELPVKAKLQVLTGKTPNGELLIGLESFTSYSHWLQKARARWIREAAIDGLGQLANIPTLWGDAQLKSVLTPYRLKRVSRAVSIYAVDGIGSERRFSRVKRLAMPSQEAKPTASSQFSVANPLAARAQALKPRQSVPVQTVRRSAGTASAPSSSTP